MMSRLSYYILPHTREYVGTMINNTTIKDARKFALRAKKRLTSLSLNEAECCTITNLIFGIDKIKYFTDSVMFFIQDPDPKVNQVMISYITGAILPIVALCMTSMIVDTGVKTDDEEPVKKEEEIEETLIKY